MTTVLAAMLMYIPRALWMLWKVIVKTVVYGMCISYHTRMVRTLRVWYVFLYHKRMVVPYAYICFTQHKTFYKVVEVLFQKLITQK